MEATHPPRPLGITLSSILLHILNFLTLIFIRWGEADAMWFAALFAIYICFTAIVIRSYSMGEGWARWVILIRCVGELATVKMLLSMGGVQLGQAITERVLAVVLLVYLNTAKVRGWFAGGRG
jgi:hypothetical protein